jgi:putative transposase
MGGGRGHRGGSDFAAGELSVIARWDRAPPSAHSPQRSEGENEASDRSLIRASSAATNCYDSGKVLSHVSAMLGPMSEEAAHKFWHRRGYLPHFDGDAFVQTITFRLADSLPRDLFEGLLNAVADHHQRSERIEAMIDKGRGACLLAEPANAAIVQNTIRYFDESRYRLIAWVVMPNHVHVMMEQMSGFRLGDIVHSWKRFSATRINNLRSTKGPIWAPDYVDRFIRDSDHYERAIAYIENNPVKAGLVGNPEDWSYSSFFARSGR